MTETHLEAHAPGHRRVREIWLNPIVRYAYPMVGRLCVNAMPGKGSGRGSRRFSTAAPPRSSDARRGNPADAKLIAALFPMGRKRGDHPHFRRVELDAAPATLRLKAMAEIKSSGAPCVAVHDQDLRPAQ